MRLIVLLLHCATGARAGAEDAGAETAPTRRRLLGNGTAPPRLVGGRSALDAQQLENGAALLLVIIGLCLVPTLVAVLAVAYAFATKRLRACLVHRGCLTFEGTDASAARDFAINYLPHARHRMHPGDAGTDASAVRGFAINDLPRGLAATQGAPERRAALVAPARPSRALKPHLSRALVAHANPAPRQSRTDGVPSSVVADLSSPPPRLPARPLSPGRGVPPEVGSRGAQPASHYPPSRAVELDSLLSRLNSQNTLNPVSAFASAERGTASHATRGAQRPHSAAYTVRGDGDDDFAAMLQRRHERRARTASM